MNILSFIFGMLSLAAWALLWYGSALHPHTQEDMFWPRLVTLWLGVALVFASMVM
jgi:hypothetical protein